MVTKFNMTLECINHRYEDDLKLSSYSDGT